MSGSVHMAARLAVSWTAPSLLAPSPKKARLTRSVPLSFCASAMPPATGTWAATMPPMPMTPRLTSVTWYDLPLL